MSDDTTSGTPTPSPRLVVGPFNRVEGDLEVHLDLAEGQVASARVVAPLYRGFERMLEGRAPQDALTITPRICGICSVSQSVAAARALGAATGVAARLHGFGPPKARRGGRPSRHGRG